jgi:hypothetical protein
MRRPIRLLLLPAALALVSTVLVSPAAAGPGPRHDRPEYPRAPGVQYVVDEGQLPFDALPGATVSWVC